MKSFVAATALAFISGAAARTFTVYNNCPFTIWYVVVLLSRDVRTHCSSGPLYVLLGT